MQFFDALRQKTFSVHIYPTNNSEMAIDIDPQLDGWTAV